MRRHCCRNKKVLCAYGEGRARTSSSREGNKCRQHSGREGVIVDTKPLRERQKGADNRCDTACTD